MHFDLYFILNMGMMLIWALVLVGYDVYKLRLILSYVMSCNDFTQRLICYPLFWCWFGEAGSEWFTNRQGRV